LDAINKKTYHFSASSAADANTWARKHLQHTEIVTAQIITYQQHVNAYKILLPHLKFRLRWWYFTWQQHEVSEVPFSHEECLWIGPHKYPIIGWLKCNNVPHINILNWWHHPLN